MIKEKMSRIEKMLSDNFEILTTTHPNLLQTCIDKKYFIATIERYKKDSVPITMNNERIDQVNRYILIDTTKNLTDFLDYDRYESYTHMLFQRFYDVQDEDWVIC